MDLLFQIATIIGGAIGLWIVQVIITLVIAGVIAFMVAKARTKGDGVIAIIITIILIFILGAIISLATSYYLLALVLPILADWLSMPELIIEPTLRNLIILSVIIFIIRLVTGKGGSINTKKE